jgi:hypothetical protein
MQKMYPDTPYQDKYLLFLQCDLYWKYAYENMRCSIKIESINGTEINVPETKIRRPYPNKNVTQLSMKRKRSYCDYGIIIPFDSYKEMTNICEIQVRWDVVFGSKQENGTMQIRKHILISTHKVSFKIDKSNKMYGIKCDEYTMFANDEILKINPERNPLEEYDIYICYHEGHAIGQEKELIVYGKYTEEETSEKISNVYSEVEENKTLYERVSVDFYERTHEIKPFEILKKTYRLKG